MGMVDPGGHVRPVAQGRHVDALEAPTVAEKVPVGHGVHAVVPEASAYLPAAHAVQLVLKPAPRVAENLPTAHLLHVVAELAPENVLNVPAGHTLEQFFPSGENAPGPHSAHLLGATGPVPGGHVVLVKAHAVAPGLLNAPPEHEAAHAYCPADGLNLPASHAAQTPLAGVVTANVPGGHVSVVNAQVVAPEGEKAPAAHGAQVVLEAAPVAALARPAGQGLQRACPENSLKEPGAQEVHEEAPAGLNVPGPHTVSVRVVSLEVHMEPSGQGTQVPHVGVTTEGGRKKPGPREQVMPQKTSPKTTGAGSSKKATSWRARRSIL